MTTVNENTLISDLKAGDFLPLESSNGRYGTWLKKVVVSVTTTKTGRFNVTAKAFFRSLEGEVSESEYLVYRASKNTRVGRV